MLLSLLQARRDWPGDVLATRLDISHRTVRRDVDRLRELGYAIQAVKGPHGGYRLDAGAELPPLLFDDDQVMALAVALQTAPSTGAGIEEAAGRALATIRQVMPARLRRRLDMLRFTAVPPLQGENRQAEPGVLMALSAAVNAREVLRFDYAEVTGHVASIGPVPPGTAQRRRVEPHHLVASGGRWYLVAWDLERNDWRIFRADRIHPHVPTGPRFTERTVPGGVHNFVSARFRGSAGENDWPCRGTVVLSLPAGAVLPFAGDGSVEALGEERCRLTSGSWSWEALAASLGRFEADVEVEGPPELAAACGRLAARFAAAAAGKSLHPADDPQEQDL